MNDDTDTGYDCMQWYQQQGQHQFWQEQQVAAEAANHDNKENEHVQESNT